MSKKKGVEIDSTKVLGKESGTNPVKLGRTSKSDRISMISKSRVDQCLKNTGNGQDPLVLKEILEKDTEGILTQHQIDRTKRESQK